MVVIGGGRFGERAARILTRRPNTTVWVVEQSPARGDAIEGLPVQRIQQDGIDFLAKNMHRLADDDWLVPAVPIHLAAEWLRCTAKGTYKVRTVPVPDYLRPSLPHTWVTKDGSFLVSYADFLCPEDCPEPEEGCTVTGEIRTPLHEVLANLKAPGLGVHVIQSRQLAPGLGGYPVADLRSLRSSVLGSSWARWLIGTACRCHGTISGLEIAGNNA